MAENSVIPSAESLGMSPDRAILEWMHRYAPYGVLTTDTEFKVHTWNHWMESHTGKAPGEVLGRSLFTLFPELRERKLISRFERALSGESSILSTALHRYLLRMDSPLAEGEFSEMQQTARIAPLIVDKRIVGTLVVIEDVTQRELQAQTLGQQQKRDAILSWALACLLESREPRESIRELFLKIAEHLDWEAYLLYLFTPDKAALKLQSAGGITPENELSLSTLPASEPLARTLLDSAQRPPLGRGAPAPQPPTILDELGFSVTAILPLQSQDQQLGVLCFGARSRASLGEGEFELLSTIVKYLSVAIQREMTDRQLKAAQGKLNDYAEDLESQVAHRTAELREIIAELERFSYTLAHDLRAPIRALRGYCEVLLEDFSPALPDGGKLVVRNLNRACEQLDELTLDLLEFSKVSRSDLTIEKIDVEEVIDAALRLLPDGTQQISVQRPLQPVLANRALLQQSIANLIDNALKFTRGPDLPKITFWTESAFRSEGNSEARNGFSSPSGETVPAKSSTSSELLPGAGKPRVKIVVADEGIGIAPELHQKVFGIFERGTSSPKYPGTGIGLAIVARAMERMGGTCGVQSFPGEGSRFWLELPSA